MTRKNHLCRFGGCRRLSQHQGHVANPQKGRDQTHLPINEHLVDARFAISQNNRACLYVCNTRFFKGVMLRGTMEILTDSTSKEMIWQEGDTMYYPEGVTDPDYCVLKFTAFSGRYYSGFKSEDFTIE